MEDMEHIFKMFTVFAYNSIIASSSWLIHFNLQLCKYIYIFICIKIQLLVCP